MAGEAQGNQRLAGGGGGGGGWGGGANRQVTESRCWETPDK